MSWTDTDIPDDVTDVYDEGSFDDEPFIPEPEDALYIKPRWTWRRFILLMIALLVIAMLVVYMLLPALQMAFQQPPLQPLAPPVNL